MMASVGVGCGGSPSAPSSPPPTQTPPPPAPVPTTYTVAGRVVGTVTGEPIAGATVTVGDESFVTDGDGNFRLTSTAANTRGIVISGTGLLTRESRLSVASRSVTLDVIQLKPPFDLTFFQRIARNALETESGLEPLRPLRAAPRIHIRTVDEKGLRIDTRTLSVVEDALRDSAPGWSAGRFPIEVVERGPETRQGQEGWVTVLFPNPGDEKVCGRATIGTTTGFIELHYRNESCGCGSRFVAPTTVRHELGHVYGYWHTSSSRDVMYSAMKVCGQELSARELEHAKYMYSRPAGNQDPDTDPSGTTLRQPPVIVIDN
jgi:hypothetical protein